MGTSGFTSVSEGGLALLNPIWPPQTVSPVSASTGPRTLPDRAPSLENRPPLHFPALVGMTGWAQGLLEWSPMSLTGLALGRAIHLRDVAGLLGL